MKKTMLFLLLTSFLQISWASSLLPEGKWHGEGFFGYTKQKTESCALKIYKKNGVYKAQFKEFYDRRYYRELSFSVEEDGTLKPKNYDSFIYDSGSFYAEKRSFIEFDFFPVFFFESVQVDVDHDNKPLAFRLTRKQGVLPRFYISESISIYCENLKAVDTDSN